MVARLRVAGPAGAGREAGSGGGVGGDGPSAAAARERRRGAARCLRPCARRRPACGDHDVGAVALPAREPPALPVPPRRSGGRPGGGVGVSGGGRSRADDSDTWRSPRLWPQHHRPGGVRPVGSARRGHRPLLVAGPLAGVAGRLIVQGGSRTVAGQAQPQRYASRAGHPLRRPRGPRRRRPPRPHARRGPPALRGQRRRHQPCRHPPPPALRGASAPRGRGVRSDAQARHSFAPAVASLLSDALAAAGALSSLLDGAPEADVVPARVPRSASTEPAFPSAALASCDSVAVPAPVVAPLRSSSDFPSLILAPFVLALSPSGVPVRMPAAILAMAISFWAAIAAFATACWPAAVEPCPAEARAAALSAWVISDPLWSRNIAPFASAARVPDSPAGSGSAGGLLKATTGAASVDGVVLSCWARDPDWIAAMSGACSGMGESCQFQKRVMSSFSAEFDRPRTASAKTPPLGSGTKSSTVVS